MEMKLSSNLWRKVGVEFKKKKLDKKGEGVVRKAPDTEEGTTSNSVVEGNVLKLSNVVNVDRNVIVKSLSKKIVRIVFKESWKEYVFKHNVSITEFVQRLIDNVIYGMDEAKCRRFESAVIGLGAGKNVMYSGDNVYRTKVHITIRQYEFISNIRVSNHTNIIYLMCSEYFSGVC